MKNNRYIDLQQVHPDYNVFRYEKFQSDVEELKINKICMTEIMNADMMIATFGQSAYVLGCREVLTKAKKDVEDMGLSGCVIHHMYNYKNFIVAATEDLSDEVFAEIMQKTYEHYMISSSQESGLSALSRFVIVYGRENIIDRAKSAIYLHRKSQTNFIVATNEREVLNTENKESVEIFDLINYAITNDRVIPYYQGIHNNENGKIEKYEALMRITDSDGNVYLPGVFLDIAKRFKLYHSLSKIMIEKVLCDFENRKSEVSINISLFDVENDEFTDWFINRVKEWHNPSRLILEFIETENYNSGEKLYSFLNTVRQIGCKIAVDDFGVGYATYNSIISLKPDIIKIDGEIIRGLINGKDSKIIVQSINFMSKLIDSKIVAEFVENSTIQAMVLSEKISYSQGNHFAKPKPFVELEIV